MHALLVLALLGSAAPIQGSSAGLRIVVIAGEDSVNIIQQGTAVQPVVEVRDRNNLPVAGASVVFLIQGGSQVGTFGNGLTQLTVVTDATGRAAASGLQATGAGPMNIEVTATSRGESISTTIRQRNATAGAASGASGAVATASGQAARNAIRGRATAAARPPYTDYEVRLVDVGTAQVLVSAPLNPDGRFVLADVPSGRYLIHLIQLPDGRTLCTEGPFTYHALPSGNSTAININCSRRPMGLWILTTAAAVAVSAGVVIQSGSQ